VALPNDAVRINPEKGTAEVHARNLPIEDYFNLPNGLADGAHDLATVSFDASWGGPVTRRVSVHDTTFGFAGTFAEEHASVTWSGRNDNSGFHFTANQGNFATTTALGGTPFAELGFERNGIFFRADDADKGDGSDDSDRHERHDGGDALVRALAASPALAGPALTPQSRHADLLAAPPAGTDQVVQQPTDAGAKTDQAAVQQALDQVLAGLDDSPFSDNLGSFT
jgi:hypothetical protein